MTRLVLTLVAALALTACSSDAPSAPDPLAPTDAAAAAKPGGGGGGGTAELDPPATWIIAALGAGQHVGVDEKGTPYKSRDCGVNAKIFATSEASGSGDAILHTNNPKFKDRRCSRKVRFTIENAGYELDAFINVRQLHPPSGGIAVLGKAYRTMSLNPEGGPCSRLLFDGTHGSSMVEAERTAENTWVVRTTAGAAAYCEGAGTTVDLPFQLTIVADVP